MNIVLTGVRTLFSVGILICSAKNSGVICMRSEVPAEVCCV